jgi:3-oxoacyl-[acyl-carrier protein] reductase
VKGFFMPSILITGGTRGIGLALCKAFAQKGWNVATCYHQDEQAAQAAREELSKITANFMVIKADVSLEEPVGFMVQAALDKWGPLDCVVHNAGSTLNARILNVEEYQWDATLGVHLKGAFWIAKACVRPMLKQKSGHLIFISSVVATTGNIGQASYVAAKAGVLGLMRSLAAEYGGKNIRTNVVCPGFHKTRLSANLTPEAGAAIREKHFLNETTDINEVADFMVWLAGSKTISGQVFNLDSRLPGWL